MLQCSCGDVTMFLSIYKCVPSWMTLTHIGTEKYHEVSEVYLIVNEAKLLIECIHGWWW